MTKRKKEITYLFTTATITVFSEEFTALIDLNVNRGSLLAGKQAGGKAHGIKSMYFSVFHAPILAGRQSPLVELYERAEASERMQCTGPLIRLWFSPASGHKGPLVPVYTEHMDRPK